MKLKMAQKINFNAGPAQLPPEVLHETSIAVRNYKRTGLSILELPHRGKEFLDIIEESKMLVRKLANLDDDYEVLWLQGGGRMQFCMLPMNFLAGGNAGYLDTGHWAHEAMEYASYYGEAQVLASSKDRNYNYLPAWPEIPRGLAYVHLTTNNTIYGTQWHNVPAENVPLVADMSSDIFSMETDYRKYHLFYAAVQKNLGAAGVALAVVRKDWLKKIGSNIPPMLSYKAQAKENSILNTANVFGVYVSLLMLRWTAARGMVAIEEDNRRKAQLVYDAIDSSEIFTAHVSEPKHRSLMNVCFTAKTPELEKSFLELCAENDLVGIKGHRSAGGFRVSLYNAVTVEQVETLVALMRQFSETPVKETKEKSAW